MARAVDDELNETLRTLVRELMRDRYDGNASRIARELGVSQAFVSDLLSRKRGAGMALIRALARIDPERVLEAIYDEGTLRDLRLRIFASEAARWANRSGAFSAGSGVVGGPTGESAVGPGGRPGSATGLDGLPRPPGTVGERAGKGDRVFPRRLGPRKKSS
jgi:hypothetical protein